MNTLKALKRCALGLDLYLWLTYRTFTLRAPLRLTWRQLYQPFGSHPAKADNKFIVRNFRQNVLRELKKDQAGLAGAELVDGQGRLDPASLDTGHQLRHSNFKPSCRAGVLRCLRQSKENHHQSELMNQHSLPLEGTAVSAGKWLLPVAADSGLAIARNCGQCAGG